MLLEHHTSIEHNDVLFRFLYDLQQYCVIRAPVRTCHIGQSREKYHKEKDGALGGLLRRDGKYLNAWKAQSPLEEARTADALFLSTPFNENFIDEKFTK